jgi:hypothetical protein
LVPKKFADTRCGSSFFSAWLFEEIVDVLPHLLADAFCADEKAHEPFEVCHGLFAFTHCGSHFLLFMLPVKISK